MQAQYGLNLRDAETLERTSWHRLNVLVAGLEADTVLVAEMTRRRKSGDVVPDQVLESDAEADQFWRRRAAAFLAEKGPH